MSEASPELSNPRAPRAVAARRLASRPFRAKQQLFLAEGPQAVREAADLDGVLVELFATGEAAERYGEILAAAGAQGSKITIATPELLASLSETVTPQGLIGVCRFLDVPLESFLAARAPKLVALLAHVRDPGNAGTVIRCADAAGADLVIVTSESVDVYNPKAVRASAGSLFHVPVAVGVTAQQAVDMLRAAELRVLAADGGGRGRPRRRTRRRPAGGAHMLDVRQRGLGTARSTAGAGRRGGPGADPRPRREPQPGDGGSSVLIFLCPGATLSASCASPLGVRRRSGWRMVRHRGR